MFGSFLHAVSCTLHDEPASPMPRFLCAGEEAGLLQLGHLSKFLDYRVLGFVLRFFLPKAAILPS